MKRLACAVLILILFASPAAAAERVVVASPSAGSVLVVKEPAFAAKVGRALLAAVIPGTRRDEVLFLETDADVSVGPGRVVVVRRPAGPSWIPSIDVRVERPAKEPEDVCQRPGGVCVPPQVQPMPIAPTAPSPEVEPLWHRIASGILLVEAIIAVLLFAVLMAKSLALGRTRSRQEAPETPADWETVAEAE